MKAVVVENHNHALYYVHELLRQRKIAGKPWQMIHFDAHADLACPGCHVPAKACFRPNDPFKPLSPRAVDEDEDGESKTLYDLLDDTASGIAEWILPLSLGAKLRHIHWIRPGPFCLLPEGHHTFSVGAESTSSVVPDCESFVDLQDSCNVKVDSPLPYFVEDGSFVPTEKLLVPQTVYLQVYEGSNFDVQAPLVENGTPFVLDVCLDFFFCQDPFLKDLEAVNKEATKSLVDTALSSILYDGSLDNLPPDAILSRVKEFRVSLSEALGLLCSAHDKIPMASFRSSFATLTRHFYRSEQECNRVADELFVSLNNDNIVPTEFVSLAHEALPYLTLPHDDWTSEELRQTVIDERIGILRRGLRLIYPRQPFLITIARSVDDGFTPQDIAESLQTTVLQVIEEELKCYLEIELAY